MRLFLIGSILVLSASAASAATTTSQGAYGRLTTADTSVYFSVSETSNPFTHAMSSSGSLEITTGGTTTKFPCSFAISGDPVVTGQGSVSATCEQHTLTASFTIIGGGTGRSELVCTAEFSRPSETTMTVTQDGATEFSGTTSDSRVWRSFDFGTC